MSGIQTAFYIDEQTIKHLDSIAKMQQRSRSNLANFVLSLYCQKYLEQSTKVIAEHLGKAQGAPFVESIIKGRSDFPQGNGAPDMTALRLEELSQQDGAAVLAPTGSDLK